MKFLVSRTSDWTYDTAKPVDNAYSEGKDQWGHDIWRVDINSIEELMELVKEEKCEIIIGTDTEGVNSYIEVYDDYRE